MRLLFGRPDGGMKSLVKFRNEGVMQRQSGVADGVLCSCDWSMCISMDGWYDPL